MSGDRPSLAARPLIGLVRIYQAIGRPFLGGQCRFLPTCSDYSVEALARHGALRGSWLTLRRLLRCRPGGGYGYDPVPGGHQLSCDEGGEDSPAEGAQDP